MENISPKNHPHEDDAKESQCIREQRRTTLRRGDSCMSTHPRYTTDRWLRKEVFRRSATKRREGNHQKDANTPEANNDRPRYHTGEDEYDSRNYIVEGQKYH